MYDLSLLAELGRFRVNVVLVDDDKDLDAKDMLEEGRDALLAPNIRTK